MENISLSSNGQPYFYFTVASDYNTTGNISLPLTGLSMNFSVNAGQLTKVYLPSAIYYPSGSEVISNFGFHITTNQPASIVAHHHRIFFSEATTVLPTTEIADNYIVMAHKDDGSGSVFGYSEFSIVSTADNSLIEIVPSAYTSGGKPPGLPFSVTLNKGQIYQVQSINDLTGTTVREKSGNKIAVFSGANRSNVLSSFNCSGADDHLFEQNYPVTGWGNEYISIPFLNFGANQFRILASQNNTLVQFNCSNTKMLQAGQYFDTISSNPMYINSPKPIQLGQFITSCSNTMADPNFVLHKSLSYYSKKVIFDAFSDYDTSFVNIIVRSPATSSINLDANQVTFNPLISYPNYSYAQVPLGKGTHIIQSDSGFYAFAYGASFHDAYAYQTGYDGFRQTENSISFKYLNNLCQDTIIGFEIIPNLNFDSFNWQFSNGTVSVDQNPNVIFNESGNYTISLLVTDSLGCIYGGSNTLQINDCGTYTVSAYCPNVFTPNNDETNDKWKPIFDGNINSILNYELYIYNRWGLKIFETTRINGFWDGYTTSGSLCNEGVYYYVVKYNTNENGQLAPKSMNGFITLAR